MFEQFTLAERTRLLRGEPAMIRAAATIIETQEDKLAQMDARYRQLAGSVAGHWEGQAGAQFRDQVDLQASRCARLAAGGQAVVSALDAWAAHLEEFQADVRAKLMIHDQEVAQCRTEFHPTFYLEGVRPGTLPIVDGTVPAACIAAQSTLNELRAMDPGAEPYAQRLRDAIPAESADLEEQLGISAGSTDAQIGTAMAAKVKNANSSSDISLPVAREFFETYCHDPEVMSAYFTAMGGNATTKMFSLWSDAMSTTSGSGFSVPPGDSDATATETTEWKNLGEGERDARRMLLAGQYGLVLAADTWTDKKARDFGDDMIAGPSVNPTAAGFLLWPTALNMNVVKGAADAMGRDDGRLAKIYSEAEKKRAENGNVEPLATEAVFAHFVRNPDVAVDYFTGEKQGTDEEPDTSRMDYWFEQHDWWANDDQATKLVRAVTESDYFRDNYGPGAADAEAKRVAAFTGMAVERLGANQWMRADRVNEETSRNLALTSAKILDSAELAITAGADKNYTGYVVGKDRRYFADFHKGNFSRFVGAAGYHDIGAAILGNALAEHRIEAMGQKSDWHSALEMRRNGNNSELEEISDSTADAVKLTAAVHGSIHGGNIAAARTTDQLRAQNRDMAFFLAGLIPFGGLASKIAGNLAGDVVDFSSGIVLDIGSAQIERAEESVEKTVRMEEKEYTSAVKKYLEHEIFNTFSIASGDHSIAANALYEVNKKGYSDFLSEYEDIHAAASNIDTEEPGWTVRLSDGTDASRADLD